MAPKSLTDKEMESKRKYILKKGMDLMFEQGVKKTSVDDIIKAAGIAKGTFYLYFDSKEDFLTKLLIDFHHSYKETLEKMILEEKGGNLKVNLKNFLIKLLNLPEFKFYFTNSIYLNEYINDSHVKNFEEQIFKDSLILANVDVSIVKPGVVHNYLHSIYAMYFNEIMINEDVQETFDVMIDGLINYIFGGLKNEPI